jgi:DNA mismatch repair ATPase MutS
MPESKDKYLIELPASVAVPNDFIMKGKRGSGNKQINKYRTPVVEQLVQEIERAYEIQKERKARGLELIFAKFDSKRALWAAAAQATALLDALGSLAQTAAKSGYTRPRIVDCPPDQHPFIKVVQGRHPCVEKTFNSSEFIPNDLTLGCTMENGDCPRILLLSGPNMGVSFAFRLNFSISFYKPALPLTGLVFHTLGKKYSTSTNLLDCDFGPTRKLCPG